MARSQEPEGAKFFPCPSSAPPGKFLSHSLRAAELRLLTILVSPSSSIPGNTLKMSRNGARDSNVWLALPSLPSSGKTPHSVPPCPLKLPVDIDLRSSPRCSINCCGSPWRESRKTTGCESSPKENVRPNQPRGSSPIC